jgi:chorismate dehydratase
MPSEIAESGNAGPSYVLGAVSFLNAKPLVAGLVDHPQVRLEFAVPSMLAGYLCSGRVDAALVPVVDLAAGPSLRVVSDACIASDGETLTVRVFTRVPPHRITRLAADGDSHTSVVLARLIWLETFGYAPPTVPVNGLGVQERADGVLLIGDKVVAMRPRGFAYEIDLGAAWRELTGLPFVYAVWAALAENPVGELPELLSTSRDTGLAHLNEICSTEAPAAGWPVEIARRYFTEYLDYRLTERHRKGMELFLRMATEKGLLACLSAT